MMSVRETGENSARKFKNFTFDIYYCWNYRNHIKKIHKLLHNFPFLFSFIFLKKKTIKIKRNQIVFAVGSNKEEKLKRGDFAIKKVENFFFLFYFI